MSELDDLDTFVAGCSFKTGFKSKKGVKPAIVGAVFKKFSRSATRHLAFITTASAR